ncbi:HEAT repeat-containing protein 6 isoform X2 [Belonocnema kinseyi]|uniref:HEAT repeat-containing protein 6 isoform X2 n=1 Tax=Belonocnema kinseyi TaxID=2817044 RepID=UPI00143DA32A|nr:HEAT repeat-containing protein 6 isoform X2 [Belonocnema kinseyi]
MDSLREYHMADASVKIQFLIEELLSREGSNRKLISICLSKLNEMDHSTLLVTDPDAVMLLVNHLCTSIQPTENALVKSTSEFLTNLMKIGANFQGRTLMACKRWILETLEYSELVSQANILVALRILLATAPFSYINQIMCSCVRILRIITSEKIMINSSDKIGEILGIIQALMFYGIDDYPCGKPQNLRPAALSLPESIPTNSGKKNVKTNKAKSRKQVPKKSTFDVTNETLTNSKVLSKLSSDSDTSDTEASSSIIPAEWRVRMEAVKLFHNIVLIVPSRDLFGYWTQIVATGSKTNSRVITTLILKETSYKVLQIALNTLSELLRGARTILGHAEDVKCTSFITFFSMVSSVIKELHYTISLFMCTASNITILTHALKCATALAESTPYHRLSPGLASSLITNCRFHTLHKDPTVRVAALGVFEALANSEPITSEILDIIGMSSSVNDYFESLSPMNSLIGCDDAENEVNFHGTNMYNNIQGSGIKNTKDEPMSLLLDICLENISNETISVPVRLQSFKLLGVLISTGGSLVFCHLETVSTKLVTSMQELEPQIALHACRVIEIIAGRLGATHLNDTNSLFWKIVCKPILSLVQHSETILKEVACDCLGNIGLNVFSQFSKEESVLIITLLFGATRDRASAVRASALRTLGILVALPALEEDAGFLMDLAEITFSTLQDSNLGVRIKAAWTLASLCDYLIRRENNTDIEPLSLDVILAKTYESSVKATKDNDKVKCNATRVVGSVLFLCRENSILGDTTEGLEALIQCASIGNDQKVRWNACHAIGLVLSREPDRIFPKTWKEHVFPTLCNLVCDSPNFKVRTNAAWALSVCNSYGKHIISVWKSTILALENSQHVPNYVEYAHRDTFVQQLCLTLCHLAVQLDVTELLTLWSDIRDHIEDVKIYMQQFQNHVLPEKAGDLINAHIRFLKYEQDAPTSEEKRIAKKLRSLFEKKDYRENHNVCV